MPFDGTTLPQTARDLLAAKRYIKGHGWCSDGARRGKSVCVAFGLENAVRAETSDTRDRHYAAGDFLMRALSSKEQYCMIEIGRWNDTPGRTLDEVYATFDRAIALAIEGEG